MLIHTNIYQSKRLLRVLNPYTCDILLVKSGDDIFPILAKDGAVNWDNEKKKGYPNFFPSWSLSSLWDFCGGIDPVHHDDYNEGVYLSSAELLARLVETYISESDRR